MLTSICVLVSILLSYLAFQYLGEFTPEGVTFDLMRTDVLVFLVVCIIAVPLLAGTYPALILSSFRPAQALKSHLPKIGGRSTPAVRRALSVLQFSFAQLLVIGALVVGLQVRYMLHKDLGFNAAAVITFRVPSGENPDKRFIMSERLSQVEGVQMVAMQSQPPSGADGHNSLLLNFTEDEENEMWINAKFGDLNYINLYDIALITGRNFDPDDSCKGYIINEACMRKLGFANPYDVIGKTSGNVPVIGVVKDFHTESLHKPIYPTVIACDNKRLNAFAVKLNASASLHETLASVRAAWREVYANHEFDFAFVDDRIAAYYQNEQQTRKLANIATA